MIPELKDCLNGSTMLDESPGRAWKDPARPATEMKKAVPDWEDGLFHSIATSSWDTRPTARR
jgi:hypothetical protein